MIRTKVNVLIVTMLILCVALSIGCVDRTPEATEAARLADDATEKRLTNTLTNCGFDVKKVDVSGGTVWFGIYDVEKYPDYQKKQLIATLAKLAHQERKGSGGTNVYLYDGFGIRVASARHHSIDDTIVKVKLY